MRAAYSMPPSFDMKNETRLQYASPPWVWFLKFKANPQKTAKRKISKTSKIKTHKTVTSAKSPLFKNKIHGAFSYIPSLHHYKTSPSSQSQAQALAIASLSLSLSLSLI
jgi:hypothetical protein